MPTGRPTRQTLEATPLRALPFLSTLSRNPLIFALLRPRGYTDEEHNAGWALFLKAAGYKATTPTDTISFQSEARQAQLELDQWDEPHFQIAQGALRRKHPAQHDFVFEMLEPASGAAAIASVSIFLDRLDALETSPDREATRADDHAALATLAQRGIDASERQRLRALLAHAQGLPSLDGVADPAQIEAKRAQREEDLFALHLWYKDWSGTALTTIKRGDYLVNLGLATRRSPQREDEG
jgi:hypothetical protein